MTKKSSLAVTTQEETRTASLADFALCVARTICFPVQEDARTASLAASAYASLRTSFPPHAGNTGIASQADSRRASLRTHLFHTFAGFATWLRHERHFT